MNPFRLSTFGISTISAVILATVTPATAQSWDPATGALAERKISASATGITYATSFSDSSILGGERDFSLLLTGEDGLPASSLITPGTVPGTMALVVSMGDGQQGQAEFVWDGVDGSPDLDYTGLGGVDLSFHDGLDFLFNADVNAVTWTFYFYTDEFNYSTYTLAKPVTPGAVSNISYSPAFSAFDVAAGTGADFSNIGAIRITSDASLALDSRLNNLQFSSVPEPSTTLIMVLGGVSALLRRTRRR